MECPLTFGLQKIGFPLIFINHLYKRYAVDNLVTKYGHIQISKVIPDEAEFPYLI